MEMAVTLKMREVFPNLPDEVMMGLIPYLEQLKAMDFGARLPWNRSKRRRVQRAKNVILHIFSGPDQRFWEQKCSTKTTEVLCVDTNSAVPASLLDKNVFAYLLSICASGNVKAIIGGPPCRTISALRYQNDGGPGVVRDDEYPYGLPNLTVADHNLVIGDVTLMFRYLALYIVAEEVRELDAIPTQLLLEQPEDPARYRSPQDVHENGYFSFLGLRNGMTLQPSTASPSSIWTSTQWATRSVSRPLWQPTWRNCSNLMAFEENLMMKFKPQKPSEL